ncbi:MAG: S8 family serine peptidase [Bacteriovoracia bacterium]
MKKWILSILAVSMALAFAVKALAANEIMDRERLRNNLGLRAYANAEKLKHVKVAVLDNGFGGFETGKGLLPDNAQLLNLTQFPAGQTTHGTGMAQVIWGLTGKRETGPEFYLINTNGFSNLKAAIDYVIEHKIDVVLYSQVWPFGSNFDGKGFINAQVSRATAAGVIWINASGNHGAMVHNAAIKRQLKGDVVQFGVRDHLRFQNLLDENTVNISLSWSDFKDDEAYNTAKDLDVFVYDEKDQLVGSGELIQRGEAPKAKDDPNASPDNAKLSSHARETVQLVNLNRGNYRIQVRAKSNHFESMDRLRVLLKSDKQDAVIFHDRSETSEIMAPADNPTVITVGDFTGVSSIGPTADGRVKPEVSIDGARVRFTNGESFDGSSTAAAFLAAAVAVMKSEEPGLTTGQVRRFMNTLKTPLAPPMLRTGTLDLLDEWTKKLVPKDAQLVFDARGYLTALTTQDPTEIPELKAVGAKRTLPTDIIVASSKDKKVIAVAQEKQGTIVSPQLAFKKRRALSREWRTPFPAELRKLAETPK